MTCPGNKKDESFKNQERVLVSKTLLKKTKTSPRANGKVVKKPTI